MIMAALMLWIRTHQFELELAAIVCVAGMAVLLVLGFVLHERNVGRADCIRGNTADAVAELQRNDAAHVLQAAAVNQEARDYAKNLSAASDWAPIVATVPVSVCATIATSSPGRVSAAATARPVSDGTTSAGAADRGGDRGGARAGNGGRIDQTLGAIGHQADAAAAQYRAQILELQAYVRDVCRPAMTNTAAK